MKHLFFIILAAVVLLSSCKTQRTLVRTFKIPQQKESGNFASNSLKAFVTDNKGASVVVREPKDKSGSVYGLSSERACVLIENGLMKRGYNPRDRKMFENAVEKLKDGSDFQEIRKVTGTDLILEITSFGPETYEVKEYCDDLGIMQRFTLPIYNHKGKVVGQKPISYTLKGFAIEIRVILLSDNLIAGSFKYYYTPCVNGCVVNTFNENGMRYTDSSTGGENDVDVSARLPKQGEWADNLISSWIAETVIPQLFSEMGEK
jgi:hypothetical protein